jgi:hypothetical protein
MPDIRLARFLRRSVKHDCAAVEDHDPIRDAHGRRHILLNQERWQAMVA